MGRGGGRCPPAVSLQQLLSLWAGDRGGWRTGRRRGAEDARLHAWPLSGCITPGGPWPAHPSVGTAECPAVPCALTDFSFRARPGPEVGRDDSLVRHLDVRRCPADGCHRLRGPGGVARRVGCVGPRLLGPAHGLLLLRRRTPALLQTPARKGPRGSETREHRVISENVDPPPSCIKCTGGLFIPHLRENEGRERPCAAPRQAPLGRTVRLKSPRPGCGDSGLTLCSSPSSHLRKADFSSSKRNM